MVLVIVGSDNVSTHSRPKAAGYAPILAARLITGFNTQPPEGGWSLPFHALQVKARFQHTAARRRLVYLTI